MDTWKPRRKQEGHGTKHVGTTPTTKLAIMNALPAPPLVVCQGTVTVLPDSSQHDNMEQETRWAEPELR